MRISCLLIGLLLFNGSVYAQEDIKTENITETDSEIITEDEKKVDLENADLLVMKVRQFTLADMLDGYYGEGNWNEELLVKDTVGENRWLYKDENKDILFNGDSVVVFAEVKYVDEVPDEEVMKREWETLMDNMDIPLDDEYAKQIDPDNGNRSRYLYFMQQDGIRICPDDYFLGTVENEMDFFGQFVRVDVYDYGYDLIFQKISDVIDRQSVDQERHIYSPEEAGPMLLQAVDDTYQIPLSDEELIDETLRCVPMYIMVDYAGATDEYIYDIGVMARQEIYPNEIELPWCISGYFDTVLPYCYKATMGTDWERRLQTEYRKRSEDQMKDDMENDRKNHPIEEMEETEYVPSAD